MIGLVASKREDLTNNILEKYNPDEVLGTLINSKKIALTESIMPLVEQIVHRSENPIEVIENRLLDISNPLDIGSILFLTDFVRRDESFVSTDVEPWWVAVSHSKSDHTELSNLYLHGYLLGRGLSHGTRFPSKLFAISLSPILKALERDKLPRDIWYQLSPNLIGSSYSNRYSPDFRIINTISDTFIRRNLSLSELMESSQDVGVFKQLVRYIGKSYKGRNYLKGLLRDPKAKDQKLKQSVDFIRANSKFIDW